MRALQAAILWLYLFTGILYADTVEFNDGKKVENVKTRITIQTVIIYYNTGKEDSFSKSLVKKIVYAPVDWGKEVKDSDDFELSRTEFKNSLGMEFVKIPEGEFYLGCGLEDKNCLAHESPRYKVTITRPFFMSKFEVTQKQWSLVMGTNPSNFAECGENCPVEKVSWYDAHEYIRKLNSRSELPGGVSYRLPTEVEWEYAARAGAETRYYWGNDISEDYLWYNQNSKDTTHPVGLKKPNKFGLYDILGNVYEWVEDVYSKSFYTRMIAIDPVNRESGVTSARVIRGGSWGNDYDFNRVSMRDYFVPGTRNYLVGFRLVISKQ